MMATPLEVDAGGNIVLGEGPGLGYANSEPGATFVFKEERCLIRSGSFIRWR